MFSVASEGKQRRASRDARVNTRIASRRQAPTLQSMYGNQAVLRWTSAASASGAALQRKCSCGGSGGHCDCDKKEHEQGLMRKAAGTNPASRVPPVVHEVLRSPGRPLDRGTRARMEPRFGHDFSGVRVHTDARAAESARAVNALAYTVGPDIVFGAGRYMPSSTAGGRLLAHELAHVVQQSGASRGPLSIGAADSAAERQAEAAAAAAVKGGAVSDLHARPEPEWIARQPAPEGAQSGPKPSPGAGCTPAAGITNSTCSAYRANDWWLPSAYVNNATCACKTTPNVATANCVRKFLQDRLAAAPTLLKSRAAAQKALGITSPVMYEVYVQSVLTPLIYKDHVDAYRSCCCPSGPAPYGDWRGVTAIPVQPCALVGGFIKKFGSCTGSWWGW